MRTLSFKSGGITIDIIENKFNIMSHFDICQLSVDEAEKLRWFLRSGVRRIQRHKNKINKKQEIYDNKR
jgi:hypothetical protein